MSTTRLRPTSQTEAVEFVRVCLSQGVSRAKIAEFLVRLKLDPALAHQLPMPVVSPSQRAQALTGGPTVSDDTTPELELEIDEVLLRETMRADGGESASAPIVHSLPVIPSEPRKQPPVVESRIMLEAHPGRPQNREEGEIPEGFAASIGHARMLIDDNKMGMSWFRIALALTAVLILILFNINWTENDQSTLSTKFAEAKARLIPALVKRAPASDWPAQSQPTSPTRH